MISCYILLEILLLHITTACVYYLPYHGSKAFFYTSTVHLWHICFRSVHFHIFVGPRSHFRRSTFTFSSGHFHIFGPLLPFSPSVFVILVIFTINFLAILPFLPFMGHIGPIFITSGPYGSHQANMVTSVQYESQRANMPACLACVKKALGVDSLLRTTFL